MGDAKSKTRSGDAESHDWFANVEVIDAKRSGIATAFESGAPLGPPLKQVGPDHNVQGVPDAHGAVPATPGEISPDQVHTTHSSTGQVATGGAEKTLVSRFMDRYEGLPGWALLPQLFLAAGWGRAGLAHMLSARWRSGEEIIDFLATDTERHIGFYRYILTDVVAVMPVQTAFVVGIVEILIAILLATNYRVKAALVFAAFLNLQFILAGAVNPSIFYLVATIGIVIWRVEVSARPETIRHLTRLGLGIGAAIALFLVPSVRTIEPDTAIEDPALVLIFLILLSSVTLWWVNQRTVAGAEFATPAAGEATQIRQQDRPFSRVWLVMSLLATIAILIGGFALSGNTESGAIDGEPENNGAAQAEAATLTESNPLGSLRSPYPYGQAVSLSYINTSTGTRSAWQVEVLNSISSDGAQVALRPAVDDMRLALAHVRLTYQSAEGPGDFEDLRLKAVGPSGTPFAESADGCGEQTGLGAQGDQLLVTDQMEGWLCWWVPERDLGSLLLSVEATPADGVLYMSLGRD